MTDPRHANPRMHAAKGIASLLAVAWLVPTALGQNGSVDGSGAPPSVDPPTEVAPPAAAPVRQAPVSIRFNFEATTERQLIDFLAASLGCDAIVPTDLSDETSDAGRIEWVDPRFHSGDEALALADAVLRTRGLGVARRDGLLVVERLAAATRPTAGQWTRIVPLVTADGPALAESLNAALPGARTIASIGQPASSALAVTAPAAAELERIERIVNALDRAEVSGDVVAASLSHAPAAEAREALVRMLGSEGAIAGVAVADDGSGKTLVLRGQRPALDAAIAALAAIDAAPDAAPAAESSLRGEVIVVRVARRSPEAALAAARLLMPERLRREVRAGVAPDGRAVLLGGDAADLALWRAVLASVEGPDGGVARLVRLTADDAARLVDDLRRELEPARVEVLLEFDAATRELLLVGAPSAIDDALGRVARLAGGRAWERERAVLRVTGDAGEASRLVAEAIAAALPQRGSEPVRVGPFRDLSAVAIAGEPGTIELARLVIEVDGLKDGDAVAACQLRVPTVDAARLVRETRGAASASLDAATGVVRASGTPQAVEAFERALLEARGLRQPNRIARIVPTGVGDAKTLAGEFTALLGAAVPVDPVRSVPMAAVRALPSVGALYIEGEPAQVALFERILAARQAGEVAADTPLRVLEIRCGSAPAVARGLRLRFDARDAAERRLRPVLAEADGSGDALAVAMRPDMAVEVARAIDELDARDDGSAAQPREVFSSTLAQSDPAVVARALNGLFELSPMPRDAFGHALPHLRERRELFASADPATRMVWVEAARERSVALDAVVGLLDRLALPADAEVRLFRLERGDITRIAQNLRDLAARGNLSQPAAEGAPVPATPPAIVIDADPMSRTLIVVGDATAFAKTEEVLRQLGVLAAPRGVRVIDAGGLDPEQLRLRALRVAALEPVGDEAPRVAVTPDPVRGIVTAVGDEADLERFALACQRIVPRAGDALAAAASTPRHRDARSIAAALEGIRVGRTPPVAIEVASDRTIVLAGSREAVTAAASLVRATDVPPAAADATLKQWVAVLPTRDAALPAEAIARWFDTRGSSRQVGGSPDIRPDIRIDPDGDRLIVSADPKSMGEIGAIVRDLGIGEQAQDGPRGVEILQLETARADALARLLDLRPLADRPSRWREVAVRADADRNALVLSGPWFDVALLSDIAAALDGTAASAAPGASPLLVAGGDDDELRVLAVRSVAVERAAEVVRTLLGGVFVTDAAPEASQAIVSVGVDADNRRLLVAAPHAFCTLADSVVARIDGADTAREPLQMAIPSLACTEFPLEHVDAEVAARVVESVIGDRARWPDSLNAAVRDGARVVSPSVVADPAQGRIFVSAAPELMEVATRIVERLDEPRAAASRWEMRVYPIARELLSPAAAAARSALEARQRAGSRPPRVELDALAEGAVLVATGEPSWLDVVDSAIRSVEVRGPRDAARVRIVRLAHASSVQIASLPGKLLADERSRIDGEAEAVAIEVRALADARANEVVLLATPVALDLAEEVLLELDADPAAPNARSLRLYELKAGEAAVAAKSIVDLFETDDGDDPLPTVRVYPSRNSLLVRATEKQRTAIDGLVARADPTAPARARVVRTLALSPRPRAIPDTLESATQLMGAGSGVAIVADEARNALVAFGAPDAIEHAERVVAQVAAMPEAAGARVRRFELPASAEPRAIAAQATAVLAQVAADARGDGGAEELVAQARVAIADRVGERAVAFIASDDGARVVDALLSMLVRGQNAGPVALRTCRLEHASASRVAGWLREQASRSDGTLAAVDLLSSPAVVLVGSPREVAEASRAVARIDRALPKMSLREVQAHPLRGLRAADVVTLMASVAPFGASEPTLVAEPITNSVVIRGNAQETANLGDLLALLDDPTAKDLPPFEAVRIAPRSPRDFELVVAAVTASIDPARRAQLALVADAERSVFFVRAEPALRAEVRAAIEAAAAAPAPQTDTDTGADTGADTGTVQDIAPARAD